AGSPPLLPLVAIGPARRRRRARGSMLTAPGLNERRYCPAADSRSLISDLFIPWRAGAARSQTITGPLLTKHNGSAPIQADDVEGVLTDINADDGHRTAGILRHGVLLVFGALGQLRSLAGQEH